MTIPVSTLVAQLEKGDVHGELPWNNPAFQGAVLQHFLDFSQRSSKIKRDLRDLEAIKRVFGGHS